MKGGFYGRLFFCPLLRNFVTNSAKGDFESERLPRPWQSSPPQEMKTSGCFLIIWLIAGMLHVAFARNRLIIKLKPEHRLAFADKNSALNASLMQAGLGNPKRKFPRHLPPENKTNRWGKPLVDLSLMYELEVPAPMRSDFSLRFFAGRPETEYAEWEEQDAIPLSYPNDPQADSTSGNQRQALKKIRAYQAWNLSGGDTSVVIAILDTGTPVDHEDLSSQIQINPLDLPNGIDDDQNGKVDDYRGWDFGNNDSDPTPDNNGTVPGHGTSVSSLAAAAWNNATGVAGVAGKCRILPLKIWRWNNTFSNFRGYDAIVYAADRGCKVINCSWGSARVNRQYEQDIINYATFNKDALVVAAGGNTPGYFNFLPANYDHVLGVTMTDTTDQISWAASYHVKLDLSAPGVNVYGIRTDGSYGFVEGGSSMASPMVAGGAGLVRAKFPNLNALQAGELLRVNSDTIYHISGNQGYRGMAGRGRLNLQKALERNTRISVRAVDFSYSNGSGMQARAGDTLSVWVVFENYLDSLSGFGATLISLNPLLEVLNGSFNMGPMVPMERRTAGIPFRVRISPLLNTVQDLAFAVRIRADMQYEDFRYFSVRAPLPMLDIKTNLVRMSVVSNGRLGTLDISNTQGSGILYKGLPSSGEAGLMIGTGPDRVSNCVYDTTGNDNHFRIENPVAFSPWDQLESHAVHHMNDSLAGANAIGLKIKQSSFGISRPQGEDALFLSYHIENKSGQDLDSLCVGQYNDWDMENPGTNFCFWIDSLKMGVTEGRGFRTRFAATQVLSDGEPSFYAIDAVNSSANGNINLFNGFSLQEKWQTLSNGIGRPTAGVQPSGNNVVQVTGVKIRNLKQGQKRKVSFAYLMADSLPTLLRIARQNKIYFKQKNTSPSPSDSSFIFCQGDTLQTTLSGGSTATRIRVYSDSLSGQLLYAGQAYPVAVSGDSVFYVAGADSVFPGPSGRIRFMKKPVPSAFFYSALPIAGDSIALGSNINFSASDTSFSIKNQWFVNNTPKDSSRNFTFLADSLGIHNICLEQTGSGCKGRFCKSIRVYLPLSNSLLQRSNRILLYPNPARTELYIKGLEPGDVLDIFNAVGTKIFTARADSNSLLLRMGELPEGLYVLAGSGKKGNYLKKFLIRRD